MLILLFKMLGGAFFLISFMMLLLYSVYLFQKKADIVDIGWCLSFVIAVWVYFSFGSGDLWHRLLIAALVSIWALRLSWHILVRYWESSDEDPRYTAMIGSWQDKIHFKVAVMFLFQGVLAIILTTPFVIISLNQRDWSWWEFAGFCIWCIGIAGEIFADRQLARFKQNPANKGKVCQKGLWAYSRHPNYFFEWVVWIGYFLIAFPAAGGWIAIISPLLMLYLLVKVSGIPLNEAEALRSKGEAYRQYQLQVSSFIPFFRKSLDN